MKAFDIERNGTGIERTGTGIERTGTGIERTGTGIERTGTGVGRAALLAVVMASAGFSSTLSAANLSGSGGNLPRPSAPLIDDVAATVIVRDDAVALRIGDEACNLAGAGWSVSGYVTLPLNFGLNGNGSRALDEWVRSGGSRVQGDGTGDRTPSSPACEKVFDHFVPEATWANARASIHVWGEAEVTVDSSGEASLILYRWESDGARRSIGAMAISVWNQTSTQ